MPYNGAVSTGESLYPLCPGCKGYGMPADRKGKRQTGCRQSDGRIVPMKGSREGVAPRNPAMQSYIKKETLTIRRDRNHNGNEIGENIAVIKGKSRDGVQLNRAPH